MYNKIVLVVFLAMSVVYTGGMLIDDGSTLPRRLLWFFFLTMTGVFWHEVSEDSKKPEGKDGTNTQTDNKIR